MIDTFNDIIINILIENNFKMIYSNEYSRFSRDEHEIININFDKNGYFYAEILEYLKLNGTEYTQLFDTVYPKENQTLQEFINTLL